MSAYVTAGFRIQTAIAVLMGRDPDLSLVQAKHIRVGLDLARADMGGLAGLLITKGIITREEYVAAMEVAAKEEADRYERMVQSVIGHRGIHTG